MFSYQQLLGMHYRVSNNVDLQLLEFQVDINGERFTLDHVLPEIKKLLWRLGFRSRAYSRFRTTGSPVSQRSADHWFNVSYCATAEHLLIRFLFSAYQALSSWARLAFF
jgi:hypothetical protein